MHLRYGDRLCVHVCGIASPERQRRSVSSSDEEGSAAHPTVYGFCLCWSDATHTEVTTWGALILVVSFIVRNTNCQLLQLQLTPSTWTSTMRHQLLSGTGKQAKATRERERMSCRGGGGWGIYNPARVGAGPFGEKLWGPQLGCLLAFIYWNEVGGRSSHEGEDGGELGANTPSPWPRTARTACG